MKIFRFFGMALVAVCMFVNFTACSQGDSSDGRGCTKEKRLTEITVGEDFAYVLIYNDQGRLIEGRSDYGNITYKWGDDTIEVYYDGKYDCTYNLTNGLVRNCYTPSEPEPYRYFSYNIEGRLDWFVWEGDKLISMPFNDWYLTYSYNNTICKKGYLPCYLMLDWDPLFISNPEIFGTRTNQLPISCKNVPNEELKEYGQAEEYTETYEYEFDADGYISKIIIKEDNGSTYSCTLTWK